MFNKAFSFERVACVIVGHFYFLKDEYYDKFSNEKLLINKGKNNKRPCFFAFEDEITGLYWFVPLSSQVEK